MDAGDEAVDVLLARADELDLPRQAFARADEPSLPRFLDLAPGRLGETLKKAIRRVLDCDGAIEIKQNLSRHPFQPLAFLRICKQDAGQFVFHDISNG